MQTAREQLISDLISTCKQQLLSLDDLKSKSDEALNQRAHSQAWSALECIEHLNLYGDYYLPLMRRHIEAFSRKHPDYRPEPLFKSGILGNYFAQSMLPKARLNKMKTFKDKNPIHSKLNRQVLGRFEEQLKDIISLLESARKVDLGRVRIPISIAAWIRLKLGDTFRFVINHNIRHLLQAEKAARAEGQIAA